MPDEAIVQKDPLMVEFGRRGGKSRLTKMTAEERSRVAKIAAQARWKKKAEPPDPTDPSGPSRDEQWAEAGIMSTRRKACRPAQQRRESLRSRAQASLFEAEPAERKPVHPVSDSVNSQQGGARAAA